MARLPPLTLRFWGPETQEDTAGYSLFVDPSESAPMSAAPVTFGPTSETIGPESLGNPMSRQMIRVRERIANRTRIARIVAVLVAAGRKARITDADGRTCLLSTEAHDADAGTLRCSYVERAPWGDDLPPGPIVVEIDGYQSIYRLYVSEQGTVSGGIVVTLPPQIIRHRRRRLPRVAAPPGARVELVLGVVREMLDIHDLSLGGMRVDLPSSFIPRRGTRGRAIVHVPGQPARAFDVEVRSAAQPGVVSRRTMGLRVASTEDERRAFNQLVLSNAHPATATGGDYVDAIWRLYERAGYFRLSGKNEAQFARLLQCFRANTARLEAAPQLGCSVVWPDRGSNDVVAAMSVVRLYGATLLAYQLAKVTGPAPDGTPSRDVLRDVHMRAYGPFLRDSRVRWILGHVQVKPVWSTAVHRDLPGRYVGTGLAAMVRFRALEVSSAEVAFHVAGIEVRPATSGEVEKLLAWLERERPEPYRQAHDLVPERIDFRETAELWRSAGLSREREIWIAAERGVPVAAATVEDAEEAMHLFRLFEAIHVYPLVDDLARVRRGTAALLDRATDWYRARGKSAFTAFVESDDWIDRLLIPKHVDMGLADASILSAELLPEFLEQLGEVTAPKG